MKWYIHVNQHKIRKNISAEVKEPVVRVQRGRSGPSTYVNSVRIPDGSVMRYSPDNPLLACGARLVIECPSEPLVD